MLCHVFWSQVEYKMFVLFQSAFDVELQWSPVYPPHLNRKARMQKSSLGILLISERLNPIIIPTEQHSFKTLSARS